MADLISPIELAVRRTTCGDSLRRRQADGPCLNPDPPVVGSTSAGRGHAFRRAHARAAFPVNGSQQAAH